MTGTFRGRLRYVCTSSVVPPYMHGRWILLSAHVQDHIWTHIQGELVTWLRLLYDRPAASQYMNTYASHTFYI